MARDEILESNINSVFEIKLKISKEKICNCIPYFSYPLNKSLEKEEEMLKTDEES